MQFNCKLIRLPFQQLKKYHNLKYFYLKIELINSQDNEQLLAPQQHRHLSLSRLDVMFYQ